MADQLITKQELIDAQKDVKHAGEAINTKKVITPRYGEPFKSIPLVVEEGKQKTDAAVAALNAKANEVVAKGFYTSYATETALKASLPTVSEMRARADDTRKIWRWNRTSAEGAIPVTGTWTDTGPSDVDKAVEEFLVEAQRQGVALSQLDGYYNYLMQRLAQIAVDRGWDASFIADGFVNQKQINNEVISTVRYGAIGSGSLHTLREWVDSGKYSSLNAIRIKYPHATSLDNSIDWVAAQKACNMQKKGGSVKIIGCLFFRQGEKLLTKEGQYIYGQSPSFFLNTNDGNQFIGALTGDLPEYGIYYDGETGAALRCGAGTTLANMHVFGKGYIDSDGSVDILDIGEAKVHDTVGIEIEKFIITKDLSVYYFGAAFDHIVGGGDYYSRYFSSEITRCNVAHLYSETAYNQDFYGCIIRNTPTPFLFKSGKTVRSFTYFGGSIEGYRPVDGNSHAIGVPANSIMRFNGTYFENLDKTMTFGEVFGFTGGNCFLQFDGCTGYLNHYNTWVKQRAYTKIRVKSANNEFYLSEGSRVKNPTIYDLVFNKGASYLIADGSDKVNFSEGYPNIKTTGSMAQNTKLLILEDMTNVFVGQRIVVKGATNLETVIRSINGSVATLKDSASIEYSSGTQVEIYYTPNYIPTTLGTSLLNNADVKLPLDYLGQFSDIKFTAVSGECRAALTKEPGSIFNGGTSGCSTYVADGTSWNPAGKQDGLGAYPVVYRGGRFLPMVGPTSGSFTMGTEKIKSIADKFVTPTSKIILQPTNEAAANLKIWPSHRVNSTRFEVTSATTPTGTETFDYFMVD